MPDFGKKIHCFRGTAAVLLILTGAMAICACGKKDAAVSFSLEDSVLPEGEAEESSQGREADRIGLAEGAASVPADRAEDESGPLEKPSVENGADGLPEEQAPFVLPPGKPETIMVHICGAVRNPGVYELPADSRIIDAVTAGGGFLEEADQNACNLAGKVTDGCQVYIATQEESDRAGMTLEPGIQTASQGTLPDGLSAKTAGGMPSDAAAQDAEGRVNLNTADAAALKTLPGIGDSRAAAILAWREENGLFTCVEDIMKVSGIKQGAFDKIKDLITVGTG